MSREKDDDLEIPLGKRTKLYRFFEILPGVLSYSMIGLLVVFSLASPMVAAVYLLVIITITLVKAIGVAVRTVQGYNEIKQAMKVDWHKRLGELVEPHKNFEQLRDDSRDEFEFDTHVENLRAISVAPKEYPNPEKIYHAVIMVAYNEGLKTLVPTVEAVKNTSFPNERIIFVLGYEERGGKEMEENAKKLKEMYKGTFYDFIAIKHPDGLPGEIKGKGPNLTYAGERLAEYVGKKHITTENVIVTSLDSDNRMSEGYLDYVAYEFVVNENRQRMSFQPVSIFTNNIWDASAPMRVIAVS